MVQLTVMDVYQVKSCFELSLRDIQVLTKLYLPIIGKEAFTLYMMLHGEADLVKMINAESKITRLKSISDMTLEQLTHAFKSLEAIGLVTTYVHYDESNHFLFEINMPLSPKKFFNNYLYNVYLYRVLQEEDYNMTKYMFYDKEVNTSQYDNISANFSDVFYLNRHSDTGKEALAYNKNIKDERIKEASANYNLDLLYKELALLQVRKDALNSNDLERICQMGAIYNIPANYLADYIVASMKDGHFDFSLFEVKAHSYYDLDKQTSLSAVYTTQPSRYKSNEHGNSKRSEYIRQLENNSPYKLLELRQNGTPIKRDLAIVESLMVHLGLNPGVVNVLLELSMKENDERINRNYIEAIGATWKRKGITTVTEALKEAQSITKKNKTKVKEVKKTEEKEAVKVEYDDAYLEELMKKVGE